MIAASTTMLAILLAFIMVTASSAVEISLGSFRTRQHRVAGEVVAINSRVLEIRGFVYDGAAPAAYFWADTSSRPSTDGSRLQDAAPSNSCGSTEITAGFTGTQTYRVEFPQGTSLLDLLGGSISVWCEEFVANFGEVVVPDSLPGLDVSDGTDLVCTDSRGNTVTGAIPGIAKTPQGFNCEPLNDIFQVRWSVNDTGSEIIIELVGLVDETSYLGFGPSGRNSRTQMVGSDVVIADIFEGEFRAIDFYMNSRAQCSSADGVCPDLDLNLDNGVDSVSGLRDQGITAVRYTRPLVPVDVGESVGGVAVDRPISVKRGDLTYISWAIGPVSPDTGFPNFHSIAYPSDDVTIEFGRLVVDTCAPLVRQDSSPQTLAPVVKPFVRPILNCETEFTARIGPSGGAKGVTAITNRTSWGIAWYINDLLIPVITMRRGTTYTFKVSGGDDDQSPSEYHPLYLTTSIAGGFSQLSPSERLSELILAGLEITKQDFNGTYDFNVQAAGPMCAYESTAATDQALDGTFGEYFATLDTSCANNDSIINDAATLTFTPTKDTPDTIFYQCATHRNLGWKIRVVDADPLAPATEAVSDADLATNIRGRKRRPARRREPRRRQRRPKPRKPQISETT